MGRRPVLPRQPPGMERVFNLLVEELVSWPGVRMTPMFGLRAFYRGDRIFAMLPHKRSMERPNAFGYKLRAGAASKESQKWRLFELENEADMGAAVERLAMAFEAAGEGVTTAAKL